MISVFGKMETSFSGYGLAILENASDIEITEKLNRECVLQFSLPATDPKAANVAEENIIKHEGQLYTIKRITTDKAEDGAMMTAYCEQVFFGLIDEYIEDRRPTEATANYALEQALLGTEFEVGTVSVGGTNTAYFIQTNPVKAINAIIERWGGELKVTGFTVDLLDRRGTDNGVQFRYKKNLAGIHREVSTESVVTRLYAYGYDGLTLESLTGQKYIDSPHIGNYRRPKIGEYKGDEETPEALLAAAQKELTARETPMVSYSVDVVELKALAGYDHEAFELGDTITVIDEELGISVQARIVEYTRYPLEEYKSKVTLANFAEGIDRTLAQLEATRRTVDRVFTDTGNVNTAWLEGKIDALKNGLEASGAYSAAQVIPGKGFLLANTDQDSPDYGALYMGPGIFALADDKIAGEWNWRTFGTGKGFRADEINAGNANASGVNGNNLNASSFTGGTLDNSVLPKNTGTDLDSEVAEKINGSLDEYAVTTIIGNTITSGYINALKVTVLGAVTAGSLNGVTLAIGSGNNVFKATASGIHLGNSLFASAPFSVDMAGKLTANDANIEGVFRAKDGATIVTELYKDGYGGKLMINNKDGKRAVEFGTMFGVDNPGGRLFIYNGISTSDSRIRVEAYNDNYNDCGVLQLNGASRDAQAYLAGNGSYFKNHLTVGRMFEYYSGFALSVFGKTSLETVRLTPRGFPSSPEPGMVFSDGNFIWFYGEGGWRNI